MGKTWRHQEVGDLDMASTFATYIEDTKPTTGRLVYLNLSAPSLFRAAHERFAFNFMGAVINHDAGDNIGLVLSPNFAKEPGRAHQQESVVNGRLADSNLNIDRLWTLSFDSHKDNRDQKQCADTTT